MGMIDIYEKDTLFGYLKWTDETPESIAKKCFDGFISDDDWQRFKEAVNSYE